jgi:hypothetical protein
MTGAYVSCHEHTATADGKKRRHREIKAHAYTKKESKK